MMSGEATPESDEPVVAVEDGRRDTAPIQSTRWLNRTVAGAGLTSALGDFCYETTTVILPGFLAVLGIPAAVLGIIEGVADAVASFTKMISGYIADKLGHRKLLVLVGYGLTPLGQVLIALAAGRPLLLLGRVVSWFGKGLRGPLRDAIVIQAVSAQTRDGLSASTGRWTPSGRSSARCSEWRCSAGHRAAWPISQTSRRRIADTTSAAGLVSPPCVLPSKQGRGRDVSSTWRTTHWKGPGPTFSRASSPARYCFFRSSSSPTARRASLVDAQSNSVRIRSSCSRLNRLEIMDRCAAEKTPANTQDSSISAACAGSVSWISLSCRTSFT